MPPPRTTCLIPTLMTRAPAAAESVNPPPPPPPQDEDPPPPNSDDPPPRGNGHGDSFEHDWQSYQSGETPKGSPTATYVYKDARGRLFMRVTRTSTKSFPTA